MKTLILGLGNSILRDDSVGLRVVNQLQDELKNTPEIEFGEDSWGGLRLMERLVGFERAIIVDAICSGADPGTVHTLTPGELSTQRSASAHDVNLLTALELGRQAGAPLPINQDIQLIGIEAVDVHTFGETLTPAVEDAIPHAINQVLHILENG